MDLGESALKKMQDAKVHMKKVHTKNAFENDSLNQMSQAQFEIWSELLRDRTGMVLPIERKSFLVTSIGLRMREIGVESYDEYHKVLDSGANGELEWKYLIDRLTVHETRFFRHTASLDVVREYMNEKTVDAKTGSLTVQVWSAGCSTGEEAYTLAMTLDQQMSLRSDNCYYGIMATDISLPSIKFARKGIYSARRLQGMDANMRNQYFEQLEDGRYQVTQELRKRVCFTPMNVLVTSDNAIGKVDIVFCQNLLIYFDKGRRYQIVDALAEHLNPGGLLILGSGEILNWGHPAMKKIEYPGTLAYQRVESGNNTDHEN